MGAFERMMRPAGPPSGGSADGLRFKVDDAEVLAKLRALDVELSVKTLRSGLRAGAAIIRDRARDLAPVAKRAYHDKARRNRHPGDLRKSIGLRTRKSPDGHGWEAIVIVGAWYGHFPEGGVAPHYVTSRRFKSQTKQGRRKRRQHPGIKPTPYLRPAFDEKHDEAVRAFRTRIEKRIARLTRT